MNFKRIGEILSGSWVQNIINNFDPYGIQEHIDLETNRNEQKLKPNRNKENTNGKLG